MHVQIKAWWDPGPCGTDGSVGWGMRADSQTTKRAVAGTFQGSDVQCYTLIHGRLAQDSLEVKTTKSNKPTTNKPHVRDT